MTKSNIPTLLFAEVSIRSKGGISVFDFDGAITKENVEYFLSEENDTKQAIEGLSKAGFQILFVGPTSISVAAPIELYEKIFQVKITQKTFKVLKSANVVEDSIRFDVQGTNQRLGYLPTHNNNFNKSIEGMAICQPVYFHAPNPVPPPTNAWHLDVPNGVASRLQARQAHRLGVTGQGVNVVMVDSGWYRHPYFTQKGYHANAVVLGPGAANPLKDEVGHGTGESANLFAVAPKINFTMVKYHSANSLGAFNRAISLNPHIISCSWGSSITFPPLSAVDQLLSASVALAVRQNITVVFSAGNGHWGFPGQHPDAISAGGAYLSPTNQLMASNYASGFSSNVFPSRNVPDVSGLVGIQPNARYIMLPIEPGCEIDLNAAGLPFPDKDTTGSNDGWAMFSGTSAAAPQLAGLCALMKQANPHLRPYEMRSILQQTATDVTQGYCHPYTGANPATVGADLATGAGLANAWKAVQMASSF